MTAPESDRTHVLVERFESTLVLTLDGRSSRNAIGPGVYQDIRTQIIAAESDDDVGAIVLTGAGGYFSSGGNIRALRESASGTLADATANTDKLKAVITAIVDSRKPVIAAVEGGAAGAGVSLALACDMIVASDVATFTVAHVLVGLSPDGGATYFLRSALPRQIVMEMCILGQPMPAARLAQAGIVNLLVPAGETLAAARALAERAARGPRSAIGCIKGLINNVPHDGLATQLDLEASAVNRARFGPEAAEGLSAFLEKRRPDFRVGHDGDVAR